LTAAPLVYDPPVSDPSQITQRQVPAANGNPAYTPNAKE
jgi:hypothetical protein